MFENLETLQQKRSELERQISEINAEIAREFDAADERLQQLRDTLKPHGEDRHKRAYRYDPVKNRAFRLKQSQAMKAAWAAKKANGQPWSTYHQPKH